MKIKPLILSVLAFATLLHARAEDFYCKHIGLAEGLSQSSVTAIAYDSMGSLWVGTRFGLNEYRNRSVRTFFEAGEEGLYGNEVSCLFIDSAGTLWVSTEKGLSIYDKQEDKFVLKNKGPVYCALENESGLWFGGENGLVRLHSGRVFIESLEGSYIIGIYEFQGDLIVVDKGLGLWRYKGGKLEQIRIPELEGHVIMSSALKGTKLYLAIYRGGICVVDLASGQAAGALDTRNSSLCCDVVLSMLVIGEELWMGTDGGGVKKYDKTSGTIKGIGGTAGVKVSSIAGLDGKNLLISAYSRGLNTLNVNTGAMRSFILSDEKTNSRECFYGNSPLLYNIGEDKILILAIEVYDYDKKTKIFTKYSSPPENNIAGLKLCEAGADSVLYAYSSSGIYMLDTDARRIEKVPVDIGDKAILSSAVGKDRIWIGTNHGLFSYSLKDGSTSPFPTKLFYRITCLKLDNAGKLWIAADNTLFRMYDDRLEIFGENEGFAANEILTSVISDTKGAESIYLGGTNGLVEIDSNESPDISNPKELVLKGLSIAGKRAAVKSGKVRLPFKFSSIRINVALSGMDPFENVMYKYNISGRTSYSLETYDDFVDLPELKDGDYDVTCSYLGRDGLWSSPAAILRIRVMPPFYRSLWFLAIALALSVCAIVFGVRRLYSRKVKALEQKLRADNIIFINKFEDFIRSNMSDPELNVEAIASHMAMSRAALYARIKAIAGCGISQYVDNLRMEEACRLLTGTYLGITEVSDRVGFATYRYFSTKFKKKYGLAPREYRIRNADVQAGKN